MPRASQNRWPSLRLDLLAANQIFSPIFGAGFYYKTFMWPAAFWEKLYEPADPPRRGTRPRSRRAGSRTTMKRPTPSAMCW